MTALEYHIEDGVPTPFNIQYHTRHIQTYKRNIHKNNIIDM